MSNVLTEASAVYHSNNVLKNTLGLLGLTLVPTILGCYAGIGSELNKHMATSPWISFTDGESVIVPNLLMEFYE